MHTRPGAMEALRQLYTDTVAAIAAGDLEGAVTKLTAGLAIDDHYRQQYVTMYAQRAFALQRLGRHDDAIADYTQAIAMEPPINQAQYLFHRGMCWAAKGDPEQAVADYGASIALYPNHPGPYHLRAKILVNDLGRFADALPDLDRVLALRGELADVLQFRGCALVNLGRHADAVADLARANELAPDPFNDYMLAACAAAAGDEAALERHMRVALAASRGYADYFAQHADEFAPYRDRPWFKQLLGA